MSEEELASGMALICMSRPVSDRVVMETQARGEGAGAGRPAVTQRPRRAREGRLTSPAPALSPAV